LQLIDDVSQIAHAAWAAVDEWPQLLGGQMGHGGHADNIYLGDTLTDDGFRTKRWAWACARSPVGVNVPITARSGRRVCAVHEGCT
jgi:hypothetical protein